MTVQGGINKGADKKILTKKNRNILFLVCCVLLGIILLLYGNGLFDKKTPKPERGDQYYLLEQYIADLEESIEKLCSGVPGVSDVRVAVTLESGFEYVYATDSKTRPDGAVEIKYITIGSGSSEVAVYITEKLPAIAGVGIVCRGGSDPAIQQKLLALISAAYNVKTNKIYITGT